MSCTCFIRAPCQWCLVVYECDSCGWMTTPDDDGDHDRFICGYCVEYVERLEQRDLWVLYRPHLMLLKR